MLVSLKLRPFTAPPRLDRDAYPQTQTRPASTYPSQHGKLILYTMSHINHIPFQLSLVLCLRLWIPLRLASHLFISLQLSSQIQLLLPSNENTPPLRNPATPDGTLQVLCTRCSVYVNHGTNQCTKHPLRQHQMARSVKWALPVCISSFWYISISLSRTDAILSQIDALGGR